MFFPEKIHSIGDGDRVLEVGPGSSPYHRSDVLLEKKFDNAEAKAQRGHTNDLKTNKTIVYYDGPGFPFKDYEFDYVICSHVLEHIPEDEIDFFLKELQRVARKGYLEYPTVYYEYLYNFKVHKTLLNYKDNTLFFMDKENTYLNNFFSVQAFFYKTLQSGYDEIVRNNKNYFFQGFEWFNNIRTVKTADIKNVTTDSITIPLKHTPLTFKFLIKQILRKVKKLLHWKRLDHLMQSIRDYHYYKHQFRVFSQNGGERFSISEEDQLPCLKDKHLTTSFDKHYVYHTAWAARKLKDISAAELTDISSFTYFSTLVSAFIPVKFYDFRPAEITLNNFTCEHADITQLQFQDNSLKILSCMHVVEHIGLGRYGDPLDVDGDLKAIEELKRVVAVDGHLLFVVPIGGEAKIIFNAHRIYTYNQVISYFENFSLIEFALIPDQTDEGIIVNATKEIADKQNYGCGCFWLQKKRK